MKGPRLDYDVVIVGGGISGLATAWFLQQQDQSIRYALLESSKRWGGKILTDTLSARVGDPFVVEGGPDSFITQKPWALRLARNLGMEEQLLPTNDVSSKVFVLNKGRPTPLPEGVMLIVPTKFGPFATSRLISPWGKLRMGMDWFIKPKLDGEDETLADFIRRRLGNEALDKIAEPLLAGIYNAEAEKQSLLSTFPRFRAIEEKHGSLIRGMLEAKRMRAAQRSPKGKPAAPSVFVSFKGGMHVLVETLEAKLTGDKCLDAKVQALSRAGDGYSVLLEDGSRIDAKALVLAVPAYVAARLLEGLAPEAAAGLASIRYVSTGTISLAFRRDEMTHPLNGFGIVIPSSERRQINAITWTSTKFDHRAPSSHTLLRVFFGGSRTPQTMALSDQDLLATVRAELADIMGITAEPVMSRIYRWFNANPQYDVGHLGRVDQIEQALPAGVYVTGSPYRGIGIPDCVRQAEETASKVGAQLDSAPADEPLVQQVAEYA